MKLPTPLFHPHVTLASTILAVSASAASCTAFVQALKPLLVFPRIAPAVTAIDSRLIAAGIVLGVTAAVLSVLAGLGRSFAPLVDQALTNGTQPIYH